MSSEEGFTFWSSHFPVSILNAAGAAGAMGTLAGAGACGGSTDAAGVKEGGMVRSSVGEPTQAIQSKVSRTGSGCRLARSSLR